MNYDQFLETLKSSDWTVPNRSFACTTVGEVWQIAFIRMGGKFQRPGKVTFVICVRSKNLRNVEGEHQAVEKEPHSYPFKLTLDDIGRRRFEYQCKLNSYDMSEVGMTDDWHIVQRALEITIPTWLGSYTQSSLAEEIAKNGDGGYIEKIWLEDLSAD